MLKFVWEKKLLLGVLGLGYCIFVAAAAIKRCDFVSSLHLLFIHHDSNEYRPSCGSGAHQWSGVKLRRMGE